MEVTHAVRDNLRRIVKLYAGYELRTKHVDLYLKLFQEAKNLEELDRLVKEESANSANEEEKASLKRLEEIHEELKTLLGGMKT